MASTIQVRAEDDLKIKSGSLFRDLGMDTTTAIRMFLTQTVSANDFPYEIRRRATVDAFASTTEEEMLDKLKKSREQGEYKDANSAIVDMRAKYGL